jgi:hypothetical protein
MTPQKPLRNISVLVSASIPDELKQSLQAQDIFAVIIMFTQQIIAAGGRLVFGGHPTITPLIHRAEVTVGVEKEAIQLYQLRLFKQDVPQEIWDQQVFSQVHWIGDEKPADGVIPQSMMIANLTAMRQAMMQNSQAAVFIGGKTTDFYGAKPGIRDEYERFLASHPRGPVYLVGLLEGETKKIITELEQQQQREPNGLTERQLRIIHHGDNIDLIAPVIVTDIARTVKQ